VPGDALAVTDLSAAYGGPAVIRAVSLRVGPGETVAILGRNGAGKTTTLLAIAGAVRPLVGSVRLGGREVAGWPAHRIARAGLALVPQGRRIFPTLSVRENLLLGDRGGDLDLVYQLFPILKTRAGQPGRALSGGEQQMLAIARGLMTRPRLLLLDEPSEGLAPQVVERIAELMSRLPSEKGISILLAEQNLRVAVEMASRVYVLERGEVAHEAAASAFGVDHASQRRLLGV